MGCWYETSGVKTGTCGRKTGACGGAKTGICGGKIGTGAVCCCGKIIWGTVLGGYPK